MKMTIEDIKKAANNLEGVIHKTALDYSTTFSEISNNDIYLKLENLQRTGSFKIRGAYNKIANLSYKEKEYGVIASSAGNHAQGVALAATEYGIDSTIIMPQGAPIAKVAATKNYGSQVVLYGSVYDESYLKAQEICQETGATFISPFNDQDIIAGQGTIGLEVIEQLAELDLILVPIGGGGLISGVALAIKEYNPEVKVIGVEAENAASMRGSLAKGEIITLDSAATIADGIAVKKPGSLTYQICQEYIDQIITVTEEEITKAILMLLERAKLMVEGAGAVTVAALLSQKLNARNKKVVAVISGGNIDVNMIARIIERGLVKAGRRIKLRTFIEDQPGSLEQLLSKIAHLEANVISVHHNRYHPKIFIEQVEVELELETKNNEHSQEIHKILNQDGYDIQLIQ
ncbi:threonine ammonia-lyase [Natroniella sp. ANB-PHB2]|uniref:threonine ammonia-lyase n=1 Tax=Natroniella sp. ANB-PHB2 TaxID=3384444 RepID=UPI0038D44A23